LGLVLGNVSFEVIWKYDQATPADNLGRLSQFVGAYSSATNYKTSEVQQLLREKYERIM